jgi:ligand-binding sensor domain-containing protein/signal transduction histidine kinase
MGEITPMDKAHPPARDGVECPMEKVGRKGLHITLLLIALVSLAAIPQVILARGPDSPASPSRNQLPESTGPNLRFDRLSAADGLSFSLTTSILQDQQGFMWFGTRYGLNRYDGFSFTLYVLESSEDVLFSNYVENLYQDRSGDLWVSTHTDLVRRDFETGEFVHYKFDAGNPQSLGAGLIWAIGEDSTGALWVGTGQGLSRYEPSTETFARFLPDQWVLEIYADRRGGVWLGTAGGLWYYDSGSLEQQNPVQYQNDPADPTSLSSNIVTAIHEDQHGALWAGTWDGGLNRLDQATGKFTRFQHNPEDPESLSDNQVHSILEDSTGRLWIGTENGLNLLDRTTGRFFQYHYDPGDLHSLSSNVVHEIYEDRSGVLWIATQIGISKVNEIASVFTHYQQGRNSPDQGAAAQPAGLLDPQNPPNLSDNWITAVYQDRQGIVWIGTNRGGLNRLDRSTGEVTVYRHNPDDPTSLSFGEVLSICEDRAGVLWIGTSSGLDRLDPQTGTFEAEEAFRERLVMSIAEDQQGNLWVGYWTGLLRREPGASDFTEVPLLEDLVATAQILKIYPDRTGSVWISTQKDGLFRWNPSTVTGQSQPTVIHFPQDSSDPKSPGVRPVLPFYDDADGTLWLGSIDDGLVRFDRDSQTFSHYMPDTGQAKYISCVQGDDQGFLWMGTQLGLARFDPRSETFAYFDTRDGLIVGEGAAACIRNEQGEMFFGSLQGLNTFFPDQIRDNPKPPPVVITAVYLENKLLNTDLPPTEPIRLSYRQNYLSFDFAALDYAAPAKNQYAYKMEGFEADWVAAGARRHADYPDLKPGTYTFRVRASNNSGVWNEQGTAVQITITPPFWQTLWFPGLLGVVFMGVIAGGIRLRLKGVEAHSRALEQQVTERTAELSQTNVVLEQQIAERKRMEEVLAQERASAAVVAERNRLARELHDSATQSLYAVTLYADAATRLLSSGQVEPAAENLLKLRGTAKEALGEMRLLIFELRPTILTDQGLVAALRARLEAVEGRASLKTELHAEGKDRLPPQVEDGLYRIAVEALNNALRHARTPCISVSLSFEPEAIRLEVADEGIGFDPTAARNAGGLGLRGMAERAEQLGGTLTMDSSPGTGTRVIVMVPQQSEQEEMPQ